MYELNSFADVNKYDDATSDDAIRLSIISQSDKRSLVAFFYIYQEPSATSAHAKNELWDRSLAPLPLLLLLLLLSL